MRNISGWPDTALKTVEQRWLKVARTGCAYVCGEDGLCYQHSGIPAAPCPNEPEHQRTAQRLQEHCAPLVEALQTADHWLEELAGHEEQCNETGDCECGLSSLQAAITTVLHARGPADAD